MFISDNTVHVLVHVGTNDVDKKGSKEVLGRYRVLVRELKRVWVGQIELSGILPVRGGYTRNNRIISINFRLQALCQEVGIGFLNMWEHFEQGDRLFSKYGLHLNERGEAVLGKGFLRALGDGIGKFRREGVAYSKRDSHVGNCRKFVCDVHERTNSLSE